METIPKRHRGPHHSVRPGLSPYFDAGVSSPAMGSSAKAPLPRAEVTSRCLGKGCILQLREGEDVCRLRSLRAASSFPLQPSLDPTAALTGEQLLQEAQISWQGWQRGARVVALVTLVVPSRLCWLWAKMKGNVPEQPQAICHCHVGCQPRLCSLWKNSCFRKCNESKSEGGNWRL